MAIFASHFNSSLKEPLVYWLIILYCCLWTHILYSSMDVIYSTLDSSAKQRCALGGFDDSLTSGDYLKHSCSIIL